MMCSMQSTTFHEHAPADDTADDTGQDRAHDTAHEPERALAPGLDDSLRSYRLREDVDAAVLDQQTLRLSRPGTSLLLHGNTEEACGALEALRRGVPVTQAPEIVHQLWAQRLVDVHPQREEEFRWSIAGVRIDGLDAVGAPLADQLAVAGVGTLVLQDARAVTGAGPTADLSGLVGPGHRGRPRAEVLHETLARRRTGTAVFECPPGGTVRGADLHVICTAGPPVPTAQELDRWHDAARLSPAVLPVRASERGAAVGPLIIPARGLCVSCVELHIEADHGEAAAAAGTEAEAVLDPSVARIVSALATRQIQVLLAGQVRPAVADHMLVVDEDGRVTERRIRRHPACTCVVRPQPFSESPAEEPPSAEPSSEELPPGSSEEP